MNQSQCLLIFCLLFFLSCNEVKQKSTDNTTVYEVNIDALENNVVENISTYFKSPKLIPLETSDECLIKYIDDIQVSNDYIFILDRDLKRLYCFDKNGKHIRRIGSVGNGPGELTRISAFTVDDDGYIYVLDGSKNKVYVYNLEGVFKHSFSIENIGGRSGHIQHYKDFLYLDFEPFNKIPDESSPLLIKIDKTSGELVEISFVR